MRTIETHQIADVAHNVGEAVRRQFGNGMYTPQVRPERAGANYRGMQPYPANPSILVVPTRQNMQALAEGNGGERPKVFGLMVGRNIRPAVVTSRSTAEVLDLTYLAPRGGSTTDFDQINPRNPAISPTWAMLLKQAAAVQDPRVGADHDPARAMGSEVGHSVLAATVLKKPAILRQGHAVHGWTASSAGIAGAVTDQSVGLYDFRLRDGEREVGEHTTTIAAGDNAFLLKIPEFDQAMDDLADVSPVDLSVGLGLVAVQTQTEADPRVLQRSLLATMGGL